MKAIMLLNANGLYRFDEFELDSSKRLLSRNQEPIPLTPKAFDVLSFLVLNPGRVVTKEELLKAVWPDSFVEEGNLAQYISTLRKALGESSCLIVTVPGRGYQFAAQVQAQAAPLPAGIPVETLPEARPGDVFVQRVRERTRVVYEDVPAAPPAQPQPALLLQGKTSSRAGVWRWVGASALAGALLALAATQAWKHFAHPPQLSDVVMAGFTNTTGDATFDSTLNQALVIDLEQSPFLNLLPKSKVMETLAMMQRKGDEALTPELAGEVCERNNAQAVLHGAIAKLGSKYLLTLTADSCVSGKHVAGYKAEANSKEEILPALDTVAGRVRRQLGESAASLERFQTPIEQATTSSLEALRIYSQAQESLDRIEPRAALEFYQRAVALDPKFASAYYGMGATYYRLSDHNQAALYIQKAFDLRGGTTQRERLNIEIAYHYFGDYDTEAALRSLKLFIATYPNSSAKSWANLCGLYTQLGDYAQAIHAGEQALRMDPHSATRAETLSRAYKRANRFADAKRVAEAAAAMDYPSWGVHSILFQIAYAERDEAALKAITEWDLSHPQLDKSFSDLAWAAATGGRLREALDYFSRAQAEALREGNTGVADGVLRDKARVLAEYGEIDQARAVLKQHTGDADDESDLVFLQAATGDVAPAQRFVAAKNPLTEKNTVHVFFDLPLVRAQLALQAHKPAEAIQLLEPARPYQLRDFYVPTLRAQAETEAGKLDAAAEDYRLILANQGVDPISPLYPLAHLGLARVLAQQRKTDEARQQYRAFLDAWKDADANLPLLRAAKSEFAKLQ
jgi:DNA-binding winged helix-turn-helix (wHTH) protein/tetratricopeptide (TPR) repeat protein